MGVKVDFSFLRRDGGGTFPLHFWNLHKIWICKNGKNGNTSNINQQLDYIELFLKKTRKNIS